MSFATPPFGIAFDSYGGRLRRPNGPGDSSPGLRPQADALGGGTMKTLRPERSREPSSAHVTEPGSRGPSGRNNEVPPFPRASASGLSPGLKSPGPLGRWLGRSCPDLYGGIETLDEGILLRDLPGYVARVGIALICMEGLRL